MTAWGIRVTHFRDPENNLIELYSDLPKKMVLPYDWRLTDFHKRSKVATLLPQKAKAVGLA